MYDTQLVHIPTVPRSTVCCVMAKCDHLGYITDQSITVSGATRSVRIDKRKHILGEHGSISIYISRGVVISPVRVWQITYYGLAKAPS